MFFLWYLFCGDGENYTALTQNEAKQKEIDTTIRIQNSQIQHMKMKIDSLKKELSNYQVDLDEYETSTMGEIGSIKSDLKTESSRRKQENRKLKKNMSKENKDINNKISQNIQSILESKNRLDQIEDLDPRATKEKVDRIKPKSLMNDEEFEEYKAKENE